MFHFMFRPLDAHIDGGLGAIGDAFFQSAQALEKSTSEAKFLHQDLPTNYLYRHAIELFLKSAVVIVHRSLPLDYGTYPSAGAPFVFVRNEWKPLKQVHSVFDLWNYASDLLRSNVRLREISRTDWSKVPAGLEEDLRKIESIDPASTFFRYPDFKNPAADREKSDWKRVRADEILERAKPGDPPIKAFLLLDTDDNISSAFVHDTRERSEIHTVFRRAAEHLSSVPLALRMEIAGGR